MISSFYYKKVSSLVCYCELNAKIPFAVVRNEQCYCRLYSLMKKTSLPDFWYSPFHLKVVHNFRGYYNWCNFQLSL